MFRSQLNPGLPHLVCSALRFSQPFSGFLLLSLPSLFHLVALLGFPFRAFSFKRWVSSFEVPSPHVVGCCASNRLALPVIVPGCDTGLQCNFRGLIPLEARSHLKGGLVSCDGRCSPGFQFSFRGFVLCLGALPALIFTGAVPLLRRWLF